MRSARTIELDLSGRRACSASERRSIEPSPPARGTRATAILRVARPEGYHRSVPKGNGIPAADGALRPLESSRVGPQPQPLRNDQPAQAREQGLDQKGEKSGRHGPLEDQVQVVEPDAGED